MFKRKLFVLGVFALAVVTIVGSGFSAWKFATERREDVLTGVSITEAVAFGQIDVSESGQWRVNLDQDKISLQKAKANLTTANIIDENNFASADAPINLTAMWYITIDQFHAINPDVKVDDASTYDNMKIDFYLNMYLKKDTLAKYISPTVASGFTSNNSIAASAGEHIHSADDYVGYQIEFTASGEKASFDIKVGTTDKTNVSTGSVTETLKANTYYIVTMTYKVTPNDMFKYYETTNETEGVVQMPKTFAEYRDMVTSLGASYTNATGSVVNVTNASDVNTGTKFFVLKDLKSQDLIFEFQVKNMAK